MFCVVIIYKIAFFLCKMNCNWDDQCRKDKKKDKNINDEKNCEDDCKEDEEKEKNKEEDKETYVCW